MKKANKLLALILGLSASMTLGACGTNTSSSLSSNPISNGPISSEVDSSPTSNGTESIEPPISSGNDSEVPISSESDSDTPSTSDSPISPSTSESSTSESTSETPKPTIYNEWKRIEPFQGGVSKDNYFAKTETIKEETNKATTNQESVDYISGQLADLFNIEREWGYLNSYYDRDCSLYNNDKKVCSIQNKTEKTGVSAVISETINQTSNAYVISEETTNTIYNVVDDGSVTKLTPYNYYQSSVLEEGDSFKDAEGFAYPDDSGYGRYLTLNYYNSLGEDLKESSKYYTSTTAEGTDFNLWMFYEVEDTIRSLVRLDSLMITVSFVENSVKSITIDFTEYYETQEIYSIYQRIDYGYLDNGNYNKVVYDYNLYKPYGTIDFNLTPGNTDFENYKVMLENSFNGEDNSLTYDIPIQSTVRREDRDEINYANYAGFGMVYTAKNVVETNIYSDGYVVQKNYEEKTGRTGNQESTTKETQYSHDSSLIYEIIESGSEEYKVTTSAYSEKAWADLKNISESRAINLMLEICRNMFDKDMQAYELPNDYIRLSCEDIKQQTSTDAGTMRQVDILLKIVKDGGGYPQRIQVVETTTVLQLIRDFNVQYERSYYSQYTYGDAPSSTDAGYTPLDPSTFQNKA